MVLPLLGLLGLGAAAIAKPHYDNRNARVQGRYAQSVMEGIDQSDPNATRNALFGGGLLTGSEFQGDSRGAYEGQMGRQNAIRRAQISAGPAYMNAQLARDKYNNQQAEVARVREAENAALSQAGVDPTSPMASVPSVRQSALEAMGVNQANQIRNDAIAMDPHAMSPGALQALAADAQEQQRDALVQQQEFEAQQQPIVDSINTLEEIVPQFDQANPSAYLNNWTQDPDNAALINAFNKQVFSQRMAFQRKEYGGNEPPQNIQEEIARQFPMIEPGTDFKDSNTRSIIQNNMEAYLLQLKHGYGTAQRHLNERGIPAPELAPVASRQGYN